MAASKGNLSAAEASLVALIPRLHDDSQTQKLAYLCLAQCYRQSGNPEQQLVAYKEALKIDPFLPTARQGLAEYYLSHQKYAEAQEQFRMMATGPAPSLDAALNLARTGIMMRLSEDREQRDWRPIDELLAQIVHQQSRTPSVAVLEAEVLLAKDLPKDAETLLKECAAKYPHRAPIWLALINLSMYEAEKEPDAAQKEDKWKQAAAYIADAGKNENLGDVVVVREVRGSYSVRHKDPQVAAVLKALGENLGANFNDDAKAHLWANLTSLCIQANDLDLARSYCRRVAETDPTNIHNRYLFCELDLRAYEKQQAVDGKELDQWVDEIERISGRGQPYWLYAKAIRTLVESNKKDPKLLLEARGYLKDVMEMRSDWAAPAVLAGKICELQDEPDQALDFYTRAIYHLGERDGEVIRSTVQLLVPRGRIDEAKQLFDYLEKKKSPLLGEMHEQHDWVEAFRSDPAVAEKVIADSVAADSKEYKDFLRQGQMYEVLVQRLRLKAQKEGREWPRDSDMIRVGQKGINALMKAILSIPRPMRSGSPWCGSWSRSGNPTRLQAW